MTITDLLLFNFRIFEYSQIQFDDGINVIAGAKWQGKTSILEALALFALGKSVRAKQDMDLIRFGQDAAQLRLNLLSKSQHEQLAIKVMQKGKQIAVNQVRKNSISDLIGKFQMVLFTPDDLEMVKGGPEERRRFMNQYMVQLSVNFIQELRTYQRLLNQRNILLKKHQYDAIPTWDESLSKSGAKIIFERGLFIRKINEFAIERYRQLSGQEEQLTLNYRPTVDGHSLSDITSQLEEGLKRNLAKDKEKGYTSIGPHRDDIVISIENRPAARFASQGQIRSAVLSMKFSIMDYFKNVIGEYPVLLLDDVLSELDERRQSALIDMVHQTQTIMTISQSSGMQGDEWGASRFFKVAHGIITNER